MLPSTSSYAPASVTPSPAVKEEQIEYGFIGKLQGLKYEYRPDIRDRAALERNFREKFEALNRVHLNMLLHGVKDTHRELVEIEKTIAVAKDKHNAFLKELDLRLLP